MLKYKYTNTKIQMLKYNYTNTKIQIIDRQGAACFYSCLGTAVAAEQWKCSDRSNRS